MAGKFRLRHLARAGGAWHLLGLCLLLISCGAANLSDLSAAAAHHHLTKIPHILHQILLEDKQQLPDEASQSAKYPPLNLHWHNSCVNAHPLWQHELWNLERGERLLTDKYAWFLPTFRGYALNISKCDALRPFLLHAYGGLYLDFDVECFRATDQALSSFDLVLQSTELDSRDITNSMMASAPGHPFWLEVFALLQERAHYADTVSDRAHAILASTGPQLMQQAFNSYFGWPLDDTTAKTAGEWNRSGARVRVYALTEWFAPCVWNDYSCHNRVHAASLQPQQLAPLLVGHHHCSATWLKPIKDANRRKTIRLILLILFVATAAGGGWLYTKKCRSGAVSKLGHQV